MKLFGKSSPYQEKPTAKDWDHFFNAAHTGDLVGVKAFAQRWPQLIDKPDPSPYVLPDKTAIVDSLVEGHKDVVDYLSQFSFNVNQIYGDFSLLSWAIVKHQSDSPKADYKNFISLLINRGIDMSRKGEDYLTFTKLRGEDDLLPLVEEGLIARGLIFPPTAEERALEEKMRPLERALRGKYESSYLHAGIIAAVKKGLTGDIDPYGKIDNKGRSLLTFAAEESNREVFEALMMLGLDASRPDSRGLTPLMAIIMQKDISHKAPLLLALAVDVTVKDPQGRTAYDYAQKDSHGELAEQILKLQKKQEAKKGRSAPQSPKGAFNL